MVGGENNAMVTTSAVQMDNATPVICIIDAKALFWILNQYLFQILLLKGKLGLFLAGLFFLCVCFQGHFFFNLNSTFFPPKPKQGPGFITFVQYTINSVSDACV